MTRHPPTYVPSAITVALAPMTHNGVPAFSPIVPLAIIASVMTPMVFCASLAPCASDTSDADPICPKRKPRSRSRSGTDRVSV